MFASGTISANESNPPPRQMLLLDLDENLFDVRLSSDDRSDLSASAELHLDKTSITKVSLFASVFSQSTDSEEDDDENDNKPNNLIHAICKTEWSEVFAKVIAVNHRYRELKPEDKAPLVAVKILTTSTYERSKFMKNVFNKFYGEEVSNQLFGTDYYYYNRSAFTLSPTIDIMSKGSLMIFYYNVWALSLPGLTQDHVYLVDDNISHTVSAKEYGFSAIHNPTNPKVRKPETSYAKEKDGVFKQLLDIVAVADKYCDELAAALAVNKSPAITK